MQISPLNSVADCVQLLRHLTENTIHTPIWRRERPHLVVEGAAFQPGEAGDTGLLTLDTYVRSVGLSANQLVTLPGGGDVNINQIFAAAEEVPLDVGSSRAAVLPLLAQADADRCALLLQLLHLQQTRPQVQPHNKPPTCRELPVLENTAVDEDDGEQTWPTEDEVAAARAATRRHLAAGTSDYQGCWILDDDEHERGSDAGSDEMATQEDSGRPCSTAAEAPADAPWHEEMSDHDDAAMEDGEREAVDADEMRRLRQAARRRAEEDELDFPDEVEVSPDVKARVCLPCCLVCCFM